MALTDHDAKILEKFRSATIEETRTIGGNRLIQLGDWAGEIYITEHSIVYGPYHDKKEWELGWGPARDVSGAVAWAVEETKKMLLADRDRLVAKLTAKAAQ